MTGTVLTLNAGSSSIKFAAYTADAQPERLLRGHIDGVGREATLTLKTGTGQVTHPVSAPSHDAALPVIIDALSDAVGARPVVGVGHRIVHGGPERAAPVRLDVQTLDALAVFNPLAPLHQPHNLSAVHAAIAAFPNAIQVGCFDTAFHRSHSWVNDAFAIPRKYYEKGVRRYGFHGLSYDYITRRLAADFPTLAGQRICIAHLGNGASMCATHEGRSVASTMGFSPLDGLPMGTRSGQIDPGVLLYLLETEGVSTTELGDMLYKQSGLLGLSGISSDMRALQASDRPEAKQAIDYFVFRIRREVGAMAAILGGLDGLVFCGGIGENAATIRARIVEGLGFLGLEVDAASNDANAIRIGAGRVPILVIPTDEEFVIADAVVRHLA